MQRDLTVALAHDHLLQAGGAERVLVEMAHLYPQAPLYTLIADWTQFPQLDGRTIITSRLADKPGSSLYFKAMLRSMPSAWEHFDFSSFDVVISSSSAFVKGLIKKPTGVHVCYCHTPTRYLWSDSDQYVASLSLPSPAKAYLKRVLADLRVWDANAASRVDHFIANSRFIAERIRQYYHRESTVIYPPVNTQQFGPPQKPDSYYLIVSRLRPYKRVDLAVQAFNRLRLPLLVIGGGEEMTKLKAQAKSNITFLGEVSDPVRNAYLARCKAFIHPQEEDFGISAVEAMAAGRPVIAYRAGGALETVQEGITGTFFDEQNWESLAYAIMLFDVRSLDPSAIQTHARTFDTAVFSSKLSSFIDSVRPYDPRH